ncbi:MAG: NAD-binding protein [Deltaproteobacteria bacterium]|nr:NAD-binding protein [Deltaproteobacteria bacterium]
MIGQAPKTPSTFSLLHALSKKDGLPANARASLEKLQAFVQSKGGTIRRSDLSQLDDELGRLVAHNALRHRAVIETLSQGPPVPFEGRAQMVRFIRENLERLKEVEAKANTSLRAEELGPEWFAIYYTRLLANEAWNHQPGSYGQGPMLSDVLKGATRELVRLLGIDEALKSGDLKGARKKELTAQHQAASREVLLAAFVGAADPEGLARAIEKTFPSVREVYLEVAKENGASALNATPEVAQGVLMRLGQDQVYGLKVAAAQDQQHELGALPALSGTVEWMQAQGLLDHSTFRELVVRLRSHALPSFAQLLSTMERFGLSHYEVDASKGVSTSPLAVATMQRSAARVDPSYRDAWRSPEAQAKVLEKNMERSLAEARRRKQPLLVLGEGYASARSLHDAAQAYPEVRTGYVAFTQSGLNFLRDQPQLRFLVESLADALIKKLSESRPLGDWVVARELELQRESKAAPPSAQTAVVIGYGDSVGPGIARALKREGFRQVVIVDRDPKRLAQAKADGFTEVVLAQEDGALPPGSLYFTAAGRPNLINETALRSVPSGAVVVIHGSSVESDKHFIHRARTGQIPGVKAKPLERDKLPDHRTLEINFQDQGRKKALLRKMGQPFFDGRDKDLLLVDVYMAGLFAALVVAARRLKDPQEPLAMRSLSLEIQLGIAEQIRKAYGVDLRPELEAALLREPAASAAQGTGAKTTTE